MIKMMNIDNLINEDKLVSEQVSALKVREEGSVTNHQQEIQVSNKDNVVCKESLLFL